MLANWENAKNAVCMTTDARPHAARCTLSTSICWVLWYFSSNTRQKGGAHQFELGFTPTGDDAMTDYHIRSKVKARPRFQDVTVGAV